MPLKWFRIFSLEVLNEPNFIKLLQVEGRKFCVVKVNQEFFAVQNRCPHAGADLTLGFCKEKKLICSYHRYEYDLETGRGAEGQGDYLTTYPVKVLEDGIYIGFKEKWTFFKKLFRL
ncbi:Rieske (2Fe-2S) protein [Daejeonella oryzae]|uniref:Rieske (2Fe-2S) protein n=1 Tax=Daejeonella oryzae TaxID=1122943 RepID=UPI0004247F67|nr:Rieske 2Fe-2S domain-containing protein [Daejeonella oryzae]